MKGWRYSPQFWCVAAAVLISVAVYQGRTGFGTYSALGLALVALALLACIAAIRADPASSPPGASGRMQIALWVIIVLHVGLGIAMLRWTPPERVDVYLFQREAAAALVHGINPYTITHRNLYGGETSFFYGPGIVAEGRVQIGFQYPPLSLLFILPAYLAGDLRYAYIAALVASALLIATFKSGRLLTLALLLLLLNPLTFYVLSRGWTEPLVLLTICATCLAAERRSRWLPVALGAFFASKQYAVVGVPLAALLLPRFSWREYFKLLAGAALVALLFTAPLALWDFPHFWHDVVVVQIVQPFRPDALSFSVLATRLGFHPIPQFVVVFALLAATAWALWVARRTPAMFACCLGLVLIVFFVLNKQAFINYYFLVIGSLLLAAVAAEKEAAPKLGASCESVAHGLQAAGGKVEPLSSTLSTLG